MGSGSYRADLRQPISPPVAPRDMRFLLVDGTERPKQGRRSGSAPVGPNGHGEGRSGGDPGSTRVNHLLIR